MNFRTAFASRQSAAKRMQTARDGLSSVMNASETEIESLARTFAKLAGEPAGSLV